MTNTLVAASISNHKYCLFSLYCNAEHQPKQQLHSPNFLICFKFLLAITTRLEAPHIVSWEFNGTNGIFVNGGSWCSASATIEFGSATPMISYPICTTVIHVNPCNAILWGNKRQATACFGASAGWDEMNEHEEKMVQLLYTDRNHGEVEVLFFFAFGWKLAFCSHYFVRRSPKETADLPLDWGQRGMNHDWWLISIFAL